jgi:hypothetical protein
MPMEFNSNHRHYSVFPSRLLFLLILVLVSLFDTSVCAQENVDSKPLLPWQIQSRAGGSLELNPWEIAKRTQERAQQAIIKALASTRIGPRNSCSSGSSTHDATIQSRSSGVINSNTDETDDTLYDALRQEEGI